MADFTIYLGNKNYSSWSLRPWLVLKQTGVPFDEIVIPLYEATSKATIMKYSPSGTVPALKHGELVVWDSSGDLRVPRRILPDIQPLAAGPRRAAPSPAQSVPSCTPDFRRCAPICR